MLRFKDLTGKEVSEIRATDISCLVKFIWCCVVSACAREKVEFPLSLMEFADAVTPDQMRQWQEENGREFADEEPGQKKPVGITELLGHCLGVIGLSYDDFCRLRIEEIDEILRFNGQNRTEEGRRAWEIMRTQSFMTLSPFCKNLPGPNKLLPFPWDEETRDPNVPAEYVSPEERAENQRRLRGRLGW